MITKISNIIISAFITALVVRAVDFTITKISKSFDRVA